MASTPAGNESYRVFGGLDERVGGVGWFQNLQSLLLRVMTEEKKQGDSVAHDAYCRQRVEPPARMEGKEEKKEDA